MLYPVEILPGARRAVRRAVSIDVGLIARAWNAERVHRSLDLSPEGVRVRSRWRLEIGEEVAVSFAPPRCGGIFGEVTLFGRVARAEQRGRMADLGIEFLDASREIKSALSAALRGLPPPIPTGARAATRAIRELLWIDTLVTFTEDLGDRVNTFEVSEVLCALDDRDLRPSAIGGMLTGGARPYRWQHAV